MIFAPSPADVFADNDEAGRKHALQVCASVLKYAREVRLVRLPGLPERVKMRAGRRGISAGNRGELQ